MGGHIVIAAGNDALWAALLDALELGALKANPHFQSNTSRTDAADTIATILEARLATAPPEHWLALLDAAGVPCGPLHTIEQALGHRQTQARNMAITAAFPDGSPLLVAGNPVKISGHGDPLIRPKAPGLDEHRAAILAEFGF